MKMKKVLSLVLLVATLGVMLASCMAITCETKINSDGSGVAVLRYGFTREALEQLALSADDPSVTWENILSPDANEKFVENGITYYGSSETHSFASVSEFAAIFSDYSGSTGGAVNENGLVLEQASDGSFLLTVSALLESAEASGIEVAGTGDELDVETLVQSGAVVRFSFTFPDVPTQVAGSTAGVVISGNTVTLDLLKLDGVYKFSTAKNAVPVQAFSDVAASMWHYDAVTALSSGGLIQGDGNGRFRPDDSITYAEFCQILCRAKGFETGVENGYWAAKAINACKSTGYIQKRVDATPANYDTPITREAAVSAIYRAQRASMGPTISVDSDDIPDYDKISDNFKSEIVAAYRCGITHGSDAQGAFNPQGYLTRAEICQLFYNINVTKAAH